MATQSVINSIIQAYRTNFGRDPESDGLAYWIGQAQSNPNLDLNSAIAAGAQSSDVVARTDLKAAGADPMQVLSAYHASGLDANTPIAYDPVKHSWGAVGGGAVDGAVGATSGGNGGGGGRISADGGQSVGPLTTASSADVGGNLGGNVGGNTGGDVGMYNNKVSGTGNTIGNNNVTNSSTSSNYVNNSRYLTTNDSHDNTYNGWGTAGNVAAPTFNTPVLDALYGAQQQRMGGPAPTFNFQAKPTTDPIGTGNNPFSEPYPPSSAGGGGSPLSGPKPPIHLKRGGPVVGALTRVIRHGS